ncbi:acetate/propionate family kinase [Tamlana crocina]|uniref:Acetate kinase n=1 Tax=Tamlana crocina TaxID=393006 RepID=A0ABX1DDZ5_9FLAO|nr:acetate kinase [Tamlana crocina]NJX15919.1 acetate kinase [Tamlana crocina]
MQVLVLNSGSSSIKFQLFSMPEERILCSGLIERIGMNDARFVYRTTDNSIELETPILNHKKGLKLLSKQLLDSETGIIKSKEDIDIVGHRVVQGGALFDKTTQIDSTVKEQINELSSLAPLHNPANFEGIKVAETVFPNAKQAAIFDTAFHQTIPEHVFRYAIPETLFTKHKIRLYGFHGTSHKYVSEKAIEYLGKKQSKIITIHLGNGCSVTAIKDGKSIDHSMGLTPLNGLIMGTRSGDIDPAVIFHLSKNLNYSLRDIETLLLKESGMFGLTGYSDLRDILTKAERGDKSCQLALQMNAYRIKKYIGSYTAILNGLDAIVFTAGIGENCDVMRKLVCKDLDFLGIEIDEDKNQIRTKTLHDISAKRAKVKTLVIPTNEELEIAKQAVELFKN